MNKYIIFIVFVFSTFFSKAAYNDIKSISFGLKSINIVGDNLNTRPMIPIDTYNGELIQGGSYESFESGIELRYSIPLGTKELFRIPVSVDYTFFRSKELDGSSNLLRIRFSNKVNLFGFNTGLHYYIAKYKFSKAKIYTGIEARALFVHNANYMHEVDYLNPALDNQDFTVEESKDNAFRMGPFVRLGVEGRLYQDIYLNLSVASGIINLIGRDNSRGELFTPNANFQTEESLAYTIELSFLVQYRLP